MANEQNPPQARAVRDLFDPLPSIADVNAADGIWDVADFRAEEAQELSAPLPASRQDSSPGLLTGLPLLDAATSSAEPTQPPPGGLQTSHLEAEFPDLQDDVADVAPDLREPLAIDAADDVQFDEDWTSADEERAEENVSVDWDLDTDLQEFDPEARLDPWSQATEPDGVLRKAASLASRLDLTTPTEISKATDFAADLYSRWRYPQTHAALLRLADEGLDFATFKAIAALRAHWESRSDWWLHRYAGPVCQSEGMRIALTWRLANDVCQARSDFPVEGMIDEDWLDEWYGLRFGAAGYFSFAEYIAEKVQSAEVLTLYDGLCLAPGEHREERDPGDHHSDMYRLIQGRD